MNTNTLLIINIVLVVIVLAVLLTGCRCRGRGLGHSQRRTEHFDAGAGAGASESTKLEGIEEELFADLKDNKLNEKDIQKLITDGVLTDKLIDKFLSRLYTPPAGEITTPTSTATPTPETFVDNVEGFTSVGSPFQSANW